MKTGLSLPVLILTEDVKIDAIPLRGSTSGPKSKPLFSLMSRSFRIVNPLMLLEATVATPLKVSEKQARVVSKRFTVLLKIPLEGSTNLGLYVTLEAN